MIDQDQKTSSGVFQFALVEENKGALSEWSVCLRGLLGRQLAITDYMTNNYFFRIRLDLTCTVMYCIVRYDVETGIAMSENAITIKQVAEFLNVSERTVYRMAQRGDIPAFKVAGTWRVLANDLDEWIRQQKYNRTAKVRDGGKP